MRNVVRVKWYSGGGSIRYVECRLRMQGGYLLVAAFVLWSSSFGCFCCINVMYVGYVLCVCIYMRVV